ncbi:MAG: glutamine synthetase, partial [Chloroflexota bacterium]
DANPYLAIYTLFKTGTEGTIGSVAADAILPDNIYDAIDDFEGSSYIKGLLGSEVAEKYAGLKRLSADRCARLLGTQIKTAEIQFHHEVQNQYLWNQF